MNNSLDIVKKIATKVLENDGRAYFVGGFVRDFLMGIKSKDIDIEVHGIPANELKDILEENWNVSKYGSNFGIYSIKGYDIDIALPRKEHNTGKGHRDFEVFTDPWLGTKEASKRRDFTINAMMMDVLTGEITDHYNGREDLENRIIRVVDKESFADDPLRVLRAVQFASRFEFSISEETIELCRGIDMSALPPERIETEVKKILCKSMKPSIAFKYLKAMNQLDFWFKELSDLIGVEQDPIYHLEGDVWMHTMDVVDRAAKIRRQDEEGKLEIPISNHYAFMLLALTHDLGKPVTTETIDGRIHSYQHEIVGKKIAREFLERFVGEEAIIKYVLRMISLHMKPNVLTYEKASCKSTNKMFDEAPAPCDLIYIAMADRPIVSRGEEFYGDFDFLFERLEIFNTTMAKPYITGKDLIALGISPGPELGNLLVLAHKLRLAGIPKDNAIKQVMSQRKSLRKTRLAEEQNK